MKSFLKFISEAPVEPLPLSTQVGQFTKGQWESKYKAAKKKKEAAVNGLMPAQSKKLEDLWDSTWYTIIFGVLWKVGLGKVSKARLTSAGEQMDKLYAKWEEKSADLLAAAKAAKDAYAAKWANEKDPCKRMFQTKLFQAVQGGSEPDTPAEEGIWDQVHNYVSSPGNYGRVKKAYADLIRCKGSYPAQLDPSVKTIYRGINITLKTALKLVNVKKLDQTAKVGPKQMIGHETKYYPRHEVESWSSNASVAYNFAKGENSVAGPGYYEFSLADLKRDLADLKRLVAKKQKMQAQQQKIKAMPKDKRGIDYKDDLESAKAGMLNVDDDIEYTIQDQINRYLASDSPVPVVYQITPDEYCVMNPLFSNKIGHIVGVGAESEVTRIDTKAVAGTVWIPQEVIEGAKLVLEIQELIKQAKIKTPQIKVAVPVTLKKGK